MPARDNGCGAASWRRPIVCLAMMALFLGGIRLHALRFTASADTAVTSNHQSQAKRQSLETDATYCVAPPRGFAFEPSPAVSFHPVQVQSVFVPAHPDGWYFNRPPPSN